MERKTTKKVGIWCLAFALFLAHLFFRSVAHADPTPVLLDQTKTTGALISWKQVFMKSGDCSIDFPAPPELIHQALQLAEGHKLLYDVYVAPLENKAVFLLLIATYPLPLAKGHEMLGLEALLKGIVGHSPDNELVFVEKIEWNGYPAIHFLVRGGSNYFRGQAFMTGNKLFLVAMEGKEDKREESLFTRFVRSFQLIQKTH